MLKTIVSWVSMLGFILIFCSRFHMCEWQYWAGLVFIGLWMATYDTK